MSDVQETVVKAQDPKLFYSEPDIGDMLDSGSFGEVFLVKRLSDQMQFALKVSKRAERREQQELIREAALMISINDDSVLGCIDAYEWENRVWLFLPFMDTGKLTDICINRLKFRMNLLTEESCKYLAFRICRGIRALHMRNILHRDIKSDNVFISRDGDVKLADLGFSVFLSEEFQQRDTQCGTISWLAPEIINGEYYAKSVDIWALGVTIYELATGLPPFLERDRNLLKMKIVSEPIPRIASSYSEEFQDFIDRCLERRVEHRWDINRLLQHDFLQGADAFQSNWVRELGQ